MLGLDDPVLLLDSTVVPVEPGGEARITVTVYNPTPIVEEYAIEVLGPAAGWSTVEPPRLNIMPGDHASATVVLHPERYPAPPAGPTPFAVRCASRLNNANATVAEADVTVGGFCELALQVAPARSKGIWRGKHRVVVVNRGNVASQVRLSASEPGDELTFKFSPQLLDIPGTGHAQSRLKAKAQSTFLRGSPEQHRFDLTYRPVLPAAADEDATPTPLTFVQKPWLSGPLVALFALLLMAGVLIGVLLSLRGDPASQAEARSLEAPELTTVEASGVSAVRLQWSRVEGARQYLLQRIDGASTGTPVIATQQPVAAEAETFTVQQLPPATEVCFRVVADTEVGLSAPSETKCATTAEQAPFLPPSGVLVDPVVGTNTVQLTWTPSAQGARHVVFVDDQVATEVVGDRVQLAVTPGQHCFAVAGIDDGGAQTEQADGPCLMIADPAATTTVAAAATTTTVAPTTTTTVAPTTAPATTAPGATAPATTAPPSTNAVAVTPTIAVDPGFVLVVDTEPAADLEDAEPRERALDRQEEFADAGFEVAVASSPELGLGGQQAWTLFVDGLATEDDAVDLCNEVAAAGLLDSGERCLLIDRTRG